MSVDAAAGLALVAVLAAALTGVVSAQNRAAMRLAESRAAVRQAESVLFELQAGVPPAEAEAGPARRPRIVPLPDVEAPRGQAWVRVEVGRETGVTSLVGLVPAAAVPGPSTQGGGP